MTTTVLLMFQTVFLLKVQGVLSLAWDPQHGSYLEAISIAGLWGLKARCAT